MAEMYYVAPSEAEAMAASIFEAAGAPNDIAAHVAAHLIDANRAGHDSHGIIRVPEYIQWIDAGRLKPDSRPTIVKETDTTALVDGRNGFGQFNASFATNIALDKAEQQNVAAVAIRNHGHIGRLGQYSEMAARRHLILILTFGSFAHGSGIVAPFGGKNRTLGTNPWTIGIPVGDHEPVVVDFATAVSAEGKVRVARDKHQQLPAGTLLDATGNPSTNPEDLYNGGVLLPFGGHKGSALSIVAAMLGAGLTGTLNNGSGGGVFMTAINPAAFVPLEQFLEISEQALDAVKAAQPVQGQSEVMSPGEPEQHARKQRDREGLPVAADTWDRIREVAERYKVKVPETRQSPST